MANYITRIRDLLPIKWHFPQEKKARGEITEEEPLVRIASGSGNFAILATQTSWIGWTQSYVGARITAQIRVIPRLSDWKVILKLATFYSEKSVRR